MVKIYVHHYYVELVFLRLFHNTTNRIYNLIDNVGSINCLYNNIQLEIIFNPELNDNSDGYHLIDVWAARDECKINKDYSDVIFDEMYLDDIPILHKIHNLIGEKKDWLIFYLRGEKILGKYDVQYHKPTTLKPPPVWIEELLEKFTNHKIISDNCFINDIIHSTLYPNHFYAFTNSIFRWNDFVGIRWYYEYKETFANLKFDYDLMYSVRNHRLFRVEILKQLAELNDDRILIQRNDSLINANYREYDSKLKSSNINLNSIYRLKNDFDGIYDLPNISGPHPGLDLFFRVLNKAKMQVLDESFSFTTIPFNSQYLSEKTIGLILANIPFISTHAYPLEILERSVGIHPHPFMIEFKKINGNSKIFTNFVKEFMNDFENNYKLCKDWSNRCHELFMNKLETENSLLDLITTHRLENVDFIPKVLF